MIITYDTEVDELRRKVAALEECQLQGSNGRTNEYCLRHGHDWAVMPYIFHDDTNPAVCRRCGATTRK